MRENNRSKGRGRHFGRRRKDFLALILLLLAAAALAWLAEPDVRTRLKDGWAQQGSVTSKQNPDGDRNADGIVLAGLKVHYLDVEKCNCVLAESADGHFMLIDAGSNDEEHVERIVSYLKEQGVQGLDYLLITHPHRDHIYGVPEIISRFEVDEVLLGDFEVEAVGTKTFQRVMDALEAKDLLITRPVPGDTYRLGNASFSILANDDSLETVMEDLNDCSTGLMLTDGSHRFLFYGDGEEKMEKALLDSGADLKSDVLMVAHHGSNSSTKKDILRAIRPRIAVISCGIDGDGEVQTPSGKVLKRLEESGVRVYRTDEDGTVVITSTDKELTVVTER